MFAVSSSSGTVIAALRLNAPCKSSHVDAGNRDLPQLSCEQTIAQAHLLAFRTNISQSGQRRTSESGMALKSDGRNKMLLLTK